MTLHGARWFALGVLVVLGAAVGCQDEESAARERIAGDYVRELVGKGYYVRDVLTLKRDGTWIRVRTTDAPRLRPIEPDTGTYRVVGVTLNMRSLAYGGGPLHYTMLGDTLFGANAAEMQAFTGTDIGEERLVRSR